MNKIFALAFIAAGLGMSAVAVEAMPFAGARTHDNLVAPVAGGCGIGWHRSPYGGCQRNVYGLFGMGFYYVPHPSYYYHPPEGSYDGREPCKGRGVHNVCNAFGQCWWVCN
jgi:hypothetical protein